jgi:phosphoribosylformylglycinamidine synthase
MLRNRTLKYRCEHVYLRVEASDTAFSGAAHVGQVLRIPIGHGEGNYYAPPDQLEALEAHRQVVLRYCDPSGRIDDGWNPNGSVNAIASVCNRTRNVVGMMPHPERACERLLGGEDGRIVFESILRFLESARRGQSPAAAAAKTETTGMSEAEPAVGRAV